MSDEHLLDASPMEVFIKDLLAHFAKNKFRPIKKCIAIPNIFKLEAGR